MGYARSRHRSWLRRPGGGARGLNGGSYGRTGPSLPACRHWLLSSCLLQSSLLQLTARRRPQIKRCRSNEHNGRAIVWVLFVPLAGRGRSRKRIAERARGCGHFNRADRLSGSSFSTVIVMLPSCSARFVLPISMRMASC